MSVLQVLMRFGLFAPVVVHVISPCGLKLSLSPHFLSYHLL